MASSSTNAFNYVKPAPPPPTSSLAPAPSYFSSSTSSYGELDETPGDYMLFRDSQTGRTRTYTRFMERVNLAASVLRDEEHFREDEMVLIVGGVSTDTPTLIMSLLALATPFCVLPTGVPLHTGLRVLRPTRIFASVDAVLTISNVVRDAAAVLEELGAGEWTVPKIYVLGGYHESWYPVFWRMINLARKTNGPGEIPVRAVKESATAYVEWGWEGTERRISHGQVARRFGAGYPLTGTRRADVDGRVPTVLVYDAEALLWPAPCAYASTSSLAVPTPHTMLLLPGAPTLATLVQHPSVTHLRLDRPVGGEGSMGMGTVVLRGVKVCQVLGAVDRSSSGKLDAFDLASRGVWENSWYADSPSPSTVSPDALKQLRRILPKDAVVIDGSGRVIGGGEEKKVGRQGVGGIWVENGNGTYGWSASPSAKL